MWRLNICIQNWRNNMKMLYQPKIKLWTWWDIDNFGVWNMKNLYRNNLRLGKLNKNCNFKLEEIEDWKISWRKCPKVSTMITILMLMFKKENKIFLMCWEILENGLNSFQFRGLAREWSITIPSFLKWLLSKQNRTILLYYPKMMERITNFFAQIFSFFSNHMRE